MTTQNPLVRPLSRDQQRPATAPMGPVIIEGGGGTGKTHTIAARIAIALKGGEDPGRIACFTFGTAGYIDIRRRVGQFLDGNDAARRFFCGTPQQFALRLLRSGGAVAVGRSSAFSAWQRDETIDWIATQLGVNRRNRRRVFAEAQRMLDWHRLNQAGYPDKRILPERADWRDIMAEYENELAVGNAVDQGNVALLASQALEKDPQFRDAAGRDRYRLLVVDDFQNCAPVEYDLFRLLTGTERSITLAVNPNECVRMAEGADDRLLEVFRLDHPGVTENRYRLRINHRTTEELGKATNRIMNTPTLGHLTKDTEKDIFVRSGMLVGGRRLPMATPVLRSFEGRAADMYQHILDGTDAFVEQGYALEDIAIIYQDYSILDEMRPLVLSRGMRYTVLGGKPGDRDPDVRSIIGLLRCLLNPRDYAAFRSAACVNPHLEQRWLDPDVTIGIRRIVFGENVTLVQAARSQGGNRLFSSEVREGLRFFVNAQDELRMMMRDPSVDVDGLCSRAVALLKEAQGPLHALRQKSQVDQLVKLAKLVPYLRGQRGRQHDPETEMLEFLDLIEQESDRGRLAAEQHNPFDAQPGVTFSSVEAAQGLEWPIVWAVGVSDHILPGAAAAVDERRMREAQRLFYVWATRACDRLIFCHLVRSGPTQDAKPSAFLTLIGDLLSYEVIPAPAPRR